MFAFSHRFHHFSNRKKRKMEKRRKKKYLIGGHDFMKHYVTWKKKLQKKRNLDSKWLLLIQGMKPNGLKSPELRYIKLWSSKCRDFLFPGIWWSRKRSIVISNILKKVKKWFDVCVFLFIYIDILIIFFCDFI